MVKLTVSDINAAIANNIDSNGVLFYWEGDYYRAISREFIKIYKDLLGSATYEKLFQLGLVETTIADLQLEGYDLVLKHKTVPFVSYVTEWSGEMLKSAAVLTLKISVELEKSGLQLKDAHPWNVLFDGCNPVFIDFGSIIPKRTIKNWFPMEELMGTFLNPVLLMAAGFPAEARELLVNQQTKRGSRISKSDIIRQLLSKKKIWKAIALIATFSQARKIARSGDLQSLAAFIQNIEIPLPKTTWSDYCLEEVNMENFDNWIQKRKVVYDVIKKYKPVTLLDIGCNTGWFSKLAALNGSLVVAFDLDEPSINRLFLNKEARELRILPLTMNFTKPVEAYGLNLRCKAAIERYQCQMVLGLAVVHHLVFYHKMTFSDIVQKFAVFSKEYLVVEFIPKDDVHVAKWIKTGYEWYTKENFIKELSNHFADVQEFESNPFPRVIFVCKK